MRKRIIAILMCVLCAVMFTGCGGPSPTEVTTNFLDAVKYENTETIKTVYAGKTLDLLNSTIADDVKTDDDSESKDESKEEKALFKSVKAKILDFDYEIGEEKIKDDKATVEVTIKTYNLGNALTESFGSYMSQAIALAFSDTSDEDMTKLFISILQSKIDACSDKNYSKTVKVPLTKTDDGWKIDKIKDDSDLMNALSGGLVDAADTLSDAYDTDD